MSDVSKTNSVFFSGVPLTANEGLLRKFFAQPGKVLKLRLVQAKPGSSFQSGFVDYLDLRTAQRAVADLNGKLFGDGDVPIRVAMAHGSGAASKRPRSGEEGTSTEGGGSAAISGVRVEFPRGYRNPLLPGDACIEQALAHIPASEAYEAVERLRVYVLDYPQEARELLANNPQLAVAVVMILQHAGKLPRDALPAEAIVEPGANSVEQLSSSAAAPSAPAAPAPTAAANQEVAKVMDLISKMSKEQVEKIANMTPAQIDAIPNEGSRKQIAYLQKQLKLLDAM